jgi:dihydrofolate synthase / folylpolyglutamate synthase
VNFREAETYLLSLGNEVEAMKLGLENIRKLLAALGNPETNYLKVQVAGTNGKGSVCSFLDSICREAGIEVGVFTSPHLISITERVRINGVDISEEEFARIASLVRKTSESLVAKGDLETVPTYFEQVTAIALVAFAEANIKLAILETGLGGRYDATTAANAEIAAITRIDLDHQEYLGDTIEEIAAEKAAIIRADSKVVALRQSKVVDRIISGRCREQGVEPVWTGDNAVIKFDAVLAPILYGSIKTERAHYMDVEPWRMLGRHQFQNASVAISIAELLQDEGFEISSGNICLGLINASHPGRLEYFGRILLDGAHNIAGAEALSEFLKEFVKSPITMVFGAMNGKDVSEILTVLAPLADKIVLTEPSNSRSLSNDELLENLPENFSRERTFASDNVEHAMDIAETVTPDGGIVLVTGSLYLIGEVKKQLLAIS